MIARVTCFIGVVVVVYDLSTVLTVLTSRVEVQGNNGAGLISP